MGDARCTPGHHLGILAEGRCSVCGDRIKEPSIRLAVLVFVVVTAAVVLAVWVLLSWWMRA